MGDMKFIKRNVCITLGNFKDRRALPLIIKHAVGDGEEIREYIHVVDASELSVKILSEEYKDRIITITGNKSMRIKDLHMMVKEMLNGSIELVFLPSVSSTHYEITPYSFNPKISKKLVSNEYYDLGQGILECLSEVKKELDKKKKEV